MMGPEGNDDGYLVEGSTRDGTARILPLVTSPGNREVLTDWVGDHSDYELIRDEESLSADAIDCVILDPPVLFDRKTALTERKIRDRIPLPYLLLVAENEERSVRKTLREEHPDLWAVVDGVVGMPVSKYRLGDRIETLLRLRERSRDAIEQRKQLRAIRDQHTGHGVIITDSEGTIQYVNRAFEEHSGYDRAEVIGKTPSILKSGEHDEAFYEDQWETITAGNVWQDEVVYERKDGEQYVIDQTIAPVTDSEGNIEQFIAVNHEITELKELEKRLREQREQLAVLNRVLRHDIRNDLSVVLGWAEALESHVDDEGADHLRRITDSARHMYELTKSARDISAALQSGSDPELEPIDLQNVLMDEVERRRETYDHADIEVSSPPSQDTTVRANEMLASVFRNLINNAVQHNDRDTPQVTIRATEHDGTVRVEIADNGPGIQDEVKERIFEEARKGLNSEGTGMGLFLVRSLVETYDGDVWAEDNEPRGAIFVIELPTVSSQMNGEQNS
ncbi:two-component system sensor histidine kinase NtrB [Halanaeroarchaeum sulfurireducens]|uniref:histidine kinase n=1 Tax=Halanaeroarchaeum sulfurireducens TaxID=1604004 RepID=A0A0F7PHF5_9EURY|nr:PAS domain-containing sensor histidine kinase [Halanaeroarchaeum sulfurireducens]AKH98658.1 signal-transducing histidine kinase-like protein [Halanaeroarchaeum sulfurireducens]